MTTTRLKQPSINEAEENDLKNNFRRMFQMLKEEMRNSFNEMEEKTNQKLEGINKSPKENKEKSNTLFKT